MKKVGEDSLLVKVVVLRPLREHFSLFLVQNNHITFELEDTLKIH